MTCAAALHGREVGYQLLKGKFRSKNDHMVDIVRWKDVDWRARKNKNSKVKERGTDIIATEMVMVDQQ